MLEFARIGGWRVIADPPALDTIVTDGVVVRISPDDAFVISETPPVVADEHAIVTPEHGFDGARPGADQLAAIARTHIEWALPPAPALTQGHVAGVPAKIILHHDGSALLLVACAARHELEARLS